MAATRDLTVPHSARTRYTFEVADTRTVFAAAMAALCTARHATVARAGRVEAFSGAKGQFPLGLVQDSESVDGTGTVGDVAADIPPKVAVGIDEAEIVNVAVTGLANTAADRGQIVYMSADDTYTLTRPTRGIPMGFVVDAGQEDGMAKVAMFSAFERAVLCLAGSGRTILNLGSLNMTLGGSQNLRTGIILPFAGKFGVPYAIVDEAPTGAAGTGTINLEVDGVNVGGGVVTVATGDAVGDKKTGTALTGDGTETFAEGSLLDVEFTFGTVMTAGRVDLYVPVEFSLGL